MITATKTQTDQRRAALTAGLSLIIMTLASFFSYGYVHASLVVQGDASTTFQNIQSSHSLFQAEIFGWVVILICDIVVAWAFYTVMKPAHQKLSLLAAWFRLIYSAILGTAILNLLFMSLLTRTASSQISEQLPTQGMLYLNAFESIWSIGLITFGIHLAVVGYVALRFTHSPKIISILLIIAGVGYMFIHSCNVFLPQYEGMIAVLIYIFTVPMIVGELGFGLWLLFKGGKPSSAAV
ncbi:DUF4386 domain-containing protein [Paenibacillus guangzhouensis]|uniref:DUF4386 domain-containing protein n=1 Tax=Paenibacillus guangzhouensis TaxID=1473112 RepID=UPI00126706A5|nr:DUF4386 domain-containing protein [Paenibacillus guangzhouensis]